MSERLIVRAVHGDLCHGPVHQPASPAILQERIVREDGVPPFWWETMCGERGHVYVYADLFKRVEECFMCRCAELKAGLR